MTAHRLPHGYTNRTRVTAAGSVEKRYDGPRAPENARRELICLEGLRDRMPVPGVLEVDLGEPRIVMSFVGGRHGQELIDEGQARLVLRLIGHALADLQATPIGSVRLEGAGSVVVHGDFGPQNMLFDLPDERVAAILDWESAHLGRPVEDLAWAEWIVRMHHPAAVEFLPELFRASGLELPWPERHRAMVDQCESILRYCRLAGFERSSRDWEGLSDATRSWEE